ncbi:hypothetical protein PGB90_002965 [Kerria lacca]
MKEWKGRECKLAKRWIRRTRQDKHASNSEYMLERVTLGSASRHFETFLGQLCGTITTKTEANEEDRALNFIMEMTTLTLS